MSKYWVNGQAAGFVKALNGAEFQGKKMSQIIWLADTVAVCFKWADEYRLIKFWDGSVLRIQGEIIGVVDPEEFNKLPWGYPHNK